MKTPKQYAELLSSVDDRGFYSVDIRFEDVADLVAAAQAEALEEAAKAVEDLLSQCFLVADLWRHPEANPKITTLSGILKAIRNPDVTKQSDS